MLFFSPGFHEAILFKLFKGICNPRKGFFLSRITFWVVRQCSRFHFHLTYLKPSIILNLSVMEIFSQVPVVIIKEQGFVFPPVEAYKLVSKV